MATPATTERKAPARRRAPKAEHLSMPYPDLPGIDHPHFWVAHYLARLAEIVALDHLRYKMHSKLDEVTSSGLSVGCCNLFIELTKSAQYARDDGMLLYAWPGTKLFTNPEARH
ncbi:hypothetical protein [Comamonas thiooxydans]|uniref:hypothetical protein n=1 Tax=Comamonas thiooxydans TaxID=363952 RepID=UPI0001BB1CF7|nr:hypothetical protein [Comamonas thiooxydans]ACY34331.1 hypothetical protein CtCNB1_3585 [Comamonas thiooxydans]MDO1474688.1 hypothetical protein [Comamonas thiooxydans]